MATTTPNRNWNLIGQYVIKNPTVWIIMHPLNNKCTLLIQVPQCLYNLFIETEETPNKSKSGLCVGTPTMTYESISQGTFEWAMTDRQLFPAEIPCSANSNRESVIWQPPDSARTFDRDTWFEFELKPGWRWGRGYRKNVDLSTYIVGHYFMQFDTFRCHGRLDLFFTC